MCGELSISLWLCYAVQTDTGDLLGLPDPKYFRGKDVQGVDVAVYERKYLTVGH